MSNRKLPEQDPKPNPEADPNWMPAITYTYADQSRFNIQGPLVRLAFKDLGVWHPEGKMFTLDHLINLHQNLGTIIAAVIRQHAGVPQPPEPAPGEPKPEEPKA